MRHLRLLLLAAFGCHAALAQPIASTLPDTTAPTTVAEADLRFVSGGFNLAGTLTTPTPAAAKVPGKPAIVIIAGSGPTDRNGNNAAGLRTNAYAYLAWGLGQAGYATLRYDKRGLAGSRAPIRQDTLTLQHFAQDATAAAIALRNQGYGPIYLLGHSEGAHLAMLAANSGAPVDGVISLAGLGRPLRQVLHDQLSAQLPAAEVARFDTAFVAFLAGQPGPTVLPQLQISLLNPRLRTFMRSWDAVTAPQLFALIRQPKLVAQGSTDVQVTRADYDLLRAATPTADTLFVPQMNHTLKVATATTAAGQMAQYTNPKLPLHPDLVPGLLAWLQRQGQAAAPSR